MKKLNGWMRIWVVITVVWSVLALGLGGLILSEVRTPEEKRAWTVDFSCDAFVDGSTVKLLGWYSEKEIIDASREKKASEKPDLQQSVDRCASALTADYRGQRKDEVQKDIMGTVAGWIIPPLLLLLCGYAIAWIRKGFRQAS